MHINFQKKREPSGRRIDLRLKTRKQSWTREGETEWASEGDQQLPEREREREKVAVWG